MAKTTEELISMIENELVDSTSQKITGASVKNVMLEMVETIAESAGSGGGQYKYYSIDEESDATEFAYALGSVVKFYPSEEQSQIVITSPVVAGTDIKIMAAAIDMSLRIVLDGTILTNEQYIEVVLAWRGAESLDEIGAHEITEEEFYTI